jgi:hypothetical protein
MRLPNLVSIALIVRSSLRALAGQPAGLGWRLVSRAAHHHTHDAPAAGNHADKRTWYPRT